MTRETHGHRLAEWAALVGGSVPDSASDGDDSPQSVWTEDADPR